MVTHPGGTVTEVVWAATKICPLTANNGCPVTASVATHRDNQGVIIITRTATHRHFVDATTQGERPSVTCVGLSVKAFFAEGAGPMVLVKVERPDGRV